jgi:hypothetical protein
MSGRISIAFVDFAVFSYSFGSIRCVSIASFLARNWCGVQEARIKRQNSAHIHSTAVPVEEPSTASNSEVGGRNREVRFTPRSRLNSDIAASSKSVDSVEKVIFA